MADLDKYRTPLARMAQETMRAGERVLAILPFVNTPKRPKDPDGPKGRAGKVRIGVYQSYRRYRPMVLTDRRLLIFETGRTPNPRELLAAYPTDEIEVVSVAPDQFHSVRFVLELPAVGPVPFIAGRRDQDDLAVLIERLGAPS